MKSLKSLWAHGVFRTKLKDVENSMLDLATSVVAIAGLSSLPFIFMEYVRFRVRHALKAEEGR